MPKQKNLDPAENLNASPVEDFRIEEMRQEDLDQVMRIERLSFPSPWSRSYFREEITSNPLSCAFVLRNRVGNSIVGYIMYWVLQGQIHINNLAVAPDRRRQGWGEMLLRHVIALGKKAGTPRLVLEVRTNNSPAVSLYQRMGFRIVGELPGYYSNGVNALVLALDIAAMD